MRFVCLPEGSGLEPVGMGKQVIAVTTSSAVVSKGAPSTTFKWGSMVKEKNDTRERWSGRLSFVIGIGTSAVGFCSREQILSSTLNECSMSKKELRANQQSEGNSRLITNRKHRGKEVSG